MGTLYLIATPIGNLEDISARALRLLGQVHLVAAEDTRQTLKLLSHYNIQARTTSYFEHNKEIKLAAIIAALGEGDVALVSDAGTPGLNDPGYELVRAALTHGYPVSPVPGPCAPIAALTASGLPTDRFLYLGYLPRKQVERRSLLEEIADTRCSLVFLEAPHRLLAGLEDLLSILGDRQVAVARELTKLHEEIYRNSLSACLEHFRLKPPRGEITLVISGQAGTETRWEADRLQSELERRLASGQTPAQAAGEAARLSGWPRRKVYAMITAHQSTGEEHDELK
jgi:16S rRNA (cytidine1402-2'-O)-methyltransferase